MNNKISNFLDFFACNLGKASKSTFSQRKVMVACSVFLSGMLCVSEMATAQAPLEPAGGRVLTGGFVDMDWSDANPCGDKITEMREWDDNKQWYGNVNPYFGKIFPEMFLPDGSKNWYGNWQIEVARIKAQGRVPYINLEFHGSCKSMTTESVGMVAEKETTALHATSLKKF